MEQSDIYHLGKVIVKQQEELEELQQKYNTLLQYLQKLGLVSIKDGELAFEDPESININQDES